MLDIFLRVAMAITPPIIWLFIFLREDKTHPEPKIMLFKVFVAGILGGLIIYTILLYYRDIIFHFAGYKSLVSVFTLAFMEEITKFIATFIVVAKSKYLDEPIDKMIYLITGAMGFAAIENLLIFLSIPDPIYLMVARFFTAVLVHALAAGIIGFYWAKKKTLYGIMLATIVHGLFNALLYAFKDGSGALYGLWLLTIVGFFVIHDFDLIKAKRNRS